MSAEQFHSGNYHERNQFHFTREKQESYDKVSGYFKSRLYDPHIEKLSRFTREIHPGNREQYQEELLNAGSTLIKELGIKKEAFKDIRYVETFLAISDSWVMNEEARLSQSYDKERDFLIETTRVLAGEHSEYNKVANTKLTPNADSFYDAKDSLKSNRVEIAFQLSHNASDKENTEELQKLVTDFSHESLLSVPRKRMGILSSAQEVPFETKVIKADSNRGVSWKHLLSLLDVTSSAVGVSTINPATNSPAFFIPNTIFNEVKEGDWGAKAVVGHEYAHTQRHYGIGAFGHLGKTWDEYLAATISDLGHGDIEQFFSVLQHITLPYDFYSLETLMKLSATQKYGPEAFYPMASNILGFRSHLLLLATPSSAYREKFPINGHIPHTYDRKPVLSDTTFLIVKEQIEMHGEDAVLENMEALPLEHSR